MWIRRALAILAVLLVATAIGAQQRPRVITSPTDPAGGSCTVQNPPYLLIWMNGQDQQTYSCENSQWTLTKLTANAVTAPNVSATTALAAPNLYQANATLVTVCAGGGCDYTTIQAALNGTTGTANDPVTIHIMPGRYTECLEVTQTDDYKTLYSQQGVAILDCQTGTGPGGQGGNAIWVNLTAADNDDLLNFNIVGLKIRTNPNYGASLSNGVNIELPVFTNSTMPRTVGNAAAFVTMDHVEFEGCAYAAVRILGTLNPDPSRLSQITIRDSYAECAGNFIYFNNAVDIGSWNNIVRLDRDGIGGDVGSENKIFNDHGHNYPWHNSRLLSVGNYYRIVSGNTNLNLDTQSVGLFYSGFHLSTFVGDIVQLAGNGADWGPQVFGSGGTVAQSGPFGGGRLIARDVTAFLECKKTQTCVFVKAGDNARLRIQNMTMIPVGVGTFRRFWDQQNTWETSYIRYQDVNAMVAAPDLDEGSGVLEEAP